MLPQKLDANSNSFSSVKVSNSLAPLGVIARSATLSKKERVGVRGFNGYNTAQINSIPFSEVAHKYASGIRKVGAQLLMLCPYHEDHHPSFCVSPKKVNRGKCWACGKSVSVIDFVMDQTHCTFLEACERLCRDFNMAPQPPKGAAIRSANNQSSLSSHAPARPLGGSGGSKGTDPLTHILLVRNEIDNEAIGRNRMKEWDAQALAHRAYINPEWYAPFVSKENSFCKALGHLFLQEGIDLVTTDYQLGCYGQLGNPDDVMFPSIDMQGRIHNVKVQHYCTDPQSDRFLHADRNHMFWLGSLLQKQGNTSAILPPPKSSGLPSASPPPLGGGGAPPPSGVGGLAEGVLFDSTCFFGEHLLAKYPNDVVVLVESPKNAVVGRLEFPGMTWVAVGNKTNFTLRRLECLRDRRVIVIPDRDAMDEWKSILSQARHIANFEFSSFCTDKLRDLGAKADVADYIICKEKC